MFLIDDIKKAKNYFENEMCRLVNNCKKEKQNSRFSTLDFLQYGSWQDAENIVS